MEISKVSTQLTEQSSKNNELQSKVSDLESALQKAEQEASSAKTELSDLKANLDQASEQAAKEGSDRDSAQTRFAQVEAELGAANRKASDAVSRAELLEKKIETLTQLHRDNDTRNQTRLQEHARVEREAAELRTRVTGLSNENARLREVVYQMPGHARGVRVVPCLQRCLKATARMKRSAAAVRRKRDGDANAMTTNMTVSVQGAMRRTATDDGTGVVNTGGDDIFS